MGLKTHIIMRIDDSTGSSDPVNRQSVSRQNHTHMGLKYLPIALSMWATATTHMAWKCEGFPCTAPMAPAPGLQR